MPARLVLVQYDRLLVSHPFRTSVVTGAILGWAGDALTQHRQMMEQEAENKQMGDIEPAQPITFDVRRSLAFMAFSAYMSGPVNYVWLVQLQRMVSRLAPTGGIRALATKMMLQATILQPLIFLPSFFTFNGIVRGWSFQHTIERARKEYWSTLRYVWAFWTPAVAFAFGVLPIRQQAVFFAFVGFMWNACLSAFSNPRKQSSNRR